MKEEEFDYLQENLEDIKYDIDLKKYEDDIKRYEEVNELNNTVYESDIGQKIEQAIKENLSRELRNLSIKQVELAKKLGITKGMITNYKNYRAIPNILTLTLLCRELDISADDILPTDPKIEL